MNHQREGPLMAKLIFAIPGRDLARATAFYEAIGAKRMSNSATIRS